MNKKAILIAVAGVCLAVFGWDYVSVHQEVAELATQHRAPAPMLGANVPHSGTNITGGHTNVDHTNAGFESVADKIEFDDWLTGPSKFLFDNEDFKSGGTSAGANTIAANTTTLLTGNINWRAIATGTASRIDLVTSGQTASHAGIVRIDTGSATTGVAALVRGAGSTPNTTLGAGQSFHQKWWTMWTTLSDGTNTFQSTLGWTQGAAAPTDGCFATYSSAAPQSGQIICRACAASSCTTGTGGTPPTVVGGTWYQIGVDWDGTNCSCTVDGVNDGSTASTIPTAALVAGVVIVKSAGGTARNEDIDYYSELERTTAGR